MRSFRGTPKGWFNLRRKGTPINPKKMKSYLERNRNLESMGYSNYVQFLASEEWKQVRSKKLNQYPLCIICCHSATEVHHMSYDVETLKGNKDFRLVQLCRKCHCQIEFRSDTKKRSLSEANRELYRLAARNAKGRRWIQWVKCRTEEYDILHPRTKKSR